MTAEKNDAPPAAAAYKPDSVIVRVEAGRVLTRRAAIVASLAHRGQVDKIGEPYIGHPTRVAEAVCAAVGDGYAVQAAFLHDVVEDTDLTLDDLRDLGFPEEVIMAVMTLTKVKGESFADYYERVKADPLALVVKWHDVADNADPARLALVAPDTRERLRAKYERARDLLTASHA